MKKRLRTKTITQQEINTAINEFEIQLRGHLIKLYAVEQKNFDRAAVILMQSMFSLSTLDALHLSVCLEGQMPILSFDKTLIIAAKELGVETIDYSG